MKLGSWFGGCIGWMLGGPLGALLGFVLGSMVEGSDSPSSGKNNQAWGKPRNGGNSDRDNFLFSLLVLSSCVIKADGKIMHSEMEYVRRFFGRILARTRWQTQSTYCCNFSSRILMLWLAVSR